VLLPIFLIVDSQVLIAIINLRLKHILQLFLLIQYFLLLLLFQPNLSPFDIILQSRIALSLLSLIYFPYILSITHIICLTLMHWLQLHLIILIQLCLFECMYCILFSLLILNESWIYPFTLSFVQFPLWTRTHTVLSLLMLMVYRFLSFWVQLRGKRSTLRTKSWSQWTLCHLLYHVWFETIKLFLSWLSPFHIKRHSLHKVPSLVLWRLNVSYLFARRSKYVIFISA
jgi:hypothetical protein